MWNNVGMTRSEASLKEALKQIPELRAEFWKNVKVTGSGSELNQELEKAGRVADFLEFAELLTTDALQRDESCGAHFRSNTRRLMARRCATTRTSVTFPPGNIKGLIKEPELHKEPLVFEHVKLATRSYK